MQRVEKYNWLTNLFSQTYSAWIKDRASQHAAALAFYTIFSLTPLLVLVITTLSFFYEKQAIHGEIVQQLGKFIGSDTAGTIQEFILLTGQQKVTGMWTAVISALTLLLTASGGFAQLKDSLNQIWNIDHPEISGLKNEALEFARNNVLMFFMVIVAAGLVFASVAVNVCLTILNRYIDVLLHTGTDIMIFQILNHIISFLMLVALFALIYKILPDLVLSWKDVIIGALFTSILFTLGKELLSLYLTWNTAASAYKVAGAAFVLLFWTYYSGLIFYFGAEFTKVYAYTYGSKAYLNDYLNGKIEEKGVKKGLLILSVFGVISFVGGIAATLKLTKESNDS